MIINPEMFLKMIINGRTEDQLNLKDEIKTIGELQALSSSQYNKQGTFNWLLKNGHTAESAFKHLNTDYDNGFTICKKCGSYYHLGKGFTKHLSNGCLNCEGQEKHYTYYHKGNSEPRWMSVMFDDGMHYCKNKLEVNKYQELVKSL